MVFGHLIFHCLEVKTRLLHPRSLNVVKALSNGICPVSLVGIIYMSAVLFLI